MDNLNPGNKAKLTYDLHLKTKGSIFVRIKPDDIECLNRYIISVQTGNTIRLGLMIRNNYLALVHNNTIYTSELAIEPEYWQTVGIRFGDGTITINCNKQQKVFNLNVNLTGCFTAIGTNIVNDQPENHLTGVMEMLCFADYTVDNNFVNKLVDDGATIIVRKTYDELNRCKKLERFVGSAKFITDYEYEENADDTTTTLINKESNDDGKSIEYQYDDVGNITKITHKENATVKATYEYAYDIFSRLENEEYKEGNVFKHHLEYTYDTNNNIKFIISKDGNNNIIKKTEFKYKNANNIICDRLKEIVETTYGSTITSTTTTIEYNDFIGNPSKIIKDAETLNLTWQGRRLTGINGYTFEYDDNGIRTAKLGTNLNKRFVLEGTKIIQEKNLLDPTKDIFFNYDESGLLIGFTLREKEYFYKRDITGNIINVVDSTGCYLVKYGYNAWGIPTKTALLNTDEVDLVLEVNPFIYKGYYYDEETGLYLLTTRYYNPEWGRFLNADDISYLNPSSINGLNLFSYCNNNPIMYFDNMGTMPVRISQLYGNTFSSTTNLWGSPLNFFGETYGGGLIYSKNGNLSNCPNWLEIGAFYGEITPLIGLSLLKADIGIAKIGFKSNKFFSGDQNAIWNPNLFAEIGALTADGNIGVGISGKASVLSLSIGAELGNSLKISGTVYVGAGVSVDFSNGIKLGVGLGLGFEISAEFNWINTIKWIWE